MRYFTVFCFSLLLWSGVPSAQAGVILSQNFDNVLNLPGWTIINNSTAGGSTTWFQGDTGSAFSAQSGAANSYIAANFNNAPALGGDISDWLLSPQLTINNGDVLSFFTRTESPATYADRLEVRLSQNGASGNVGATTTSVGDFSALLLSVNSGFAPDGYPSAWTLETVTFSGLSGPVSGRVGFRYFVTDTSVNGDYIGIDTVSLVSSTPEPVSAALLLGGMGGLFLAARMRRAA